MRRSGVLLMPALISLGACASIPQVVMNPPLAGSPETIAVSVGPCFGFCPVYDVVLSPNGDVHFSGKRHTAEVGDRDRRSSPEVYRAVANDFAAFRPADGTTARVPCTAAISDTSSYTITWTTADGRRTVATHQRGCSDGPGHELDNILATLPKRLGIVAWAQQTTRPGLSRG
ncbi:DUF6438 domain-containing protein [Sphingomonas albertensis]|uniref:DUF6438 domain-containing protein n=1 Tax=Sphingomonas albertensis TaxID=2762591 RepID=A0ABR7AL17_9SPHN|nr:DUF6438 domain-containing protein [Sphingomonas albertensis]MBC3941161.1 hypothetical protein [Sphingomonas albertensis]